MFGEKIDYSKMDFGADGEATVLAVPGNRPWVLTKEGGEKILEEIRTASATREEREQIKEKARVLRQKPERK